jgi:hypothetical protein
VCFPANPQTGASGQRTIGGMINAFQIMRGDPGARERFQATHNGMSLQQVVQARRGMVSTPTATGG